RLVHHRAGYRPSGNVQNSRAGTVLERVYAYDLSGQLVARGDTLRGRQDFRYDPTGRILAALPGAGSHQPRELFAFDPAGNLLDGNEAQVGRHNSSEARAGLGVVRDNRLRFYQDLHFEYDVHGNVTKRTRGNRQGGNASVTALRWNADHQLVEASTTRHGVTQTTRYAYDALGRRVSKADSFGATHFLWDGDLMVLSQRGGKEALFVYEPSSFVPLASIQGTEENRQTYWYQCDQIGAPLELTDAQGRIAWAADYKVWGEATLRPVARTGTDDGPARRRIGHGPDAGWSEGASARSSAPPPIEQPFRFQGQQFDEETGLHYNRFRYYDPAVGRFASQDPIGLMGGSNAFAYASNPLGWIDIFGLQRCPKSSYPTWMKRRTGQERHHLIPHELKDHSIFSMSGMDINSAHNMIYLPRDDDGSGKATHSRFKLGGCPHNQYNQTIEDKLNKMTEVAKKEKWDKYRIQKELLDLQKNLRATLGQGNLP
ncbi:RHS repeat-associated core domain-containing protein, partial [Acidovorax sp. SUPP3434]|uniref:RHS repeat-associated core domain-containing protein n=1 Tax=Acidovorax sp. SUPP3434 TaxID=2920880 RepID=UPI0024E04505